MSAQPTPQDRPVPTRIAHMHAQAGAREADCDLPSTRVAQYVTRRGLPPDYDGSDPFACNVPTKAGIPCRARALESGCCSRHGGSGEVLKKLADRSSRGPDWADVLVERVRDMVTKHPDLRERLIDMLNA